MFIHPITGFDLTGCVISRPGTVDRANPIDIRFQKQKSVFIYPISRFDGTGCVISRFGGTSYVLTLHNNLKPTTVTQ